MRAFTVATLALVASLNVEAFTTSSLPKSRDALTVSFGYIPSGFTEASYKKFKEDEKKKLAKKNLGKLGPRGFKSRSFQSFQEALERGEANHLMPVTNAKAKIKRGELRKEDIPYMQRGGAWDNSDVKGAKKAKWLNSDKEYASGGFQKEQSVSIFGQGAGLDWTGQQGRSGPAQTVVSKAPTFGRNYKAPNVYALQGKKAPQKGQKTEEEPKKKFFGLF